jgi:hypothetical protein
MRIHTKVTTNIKVQEKHPAQAGPNSKENMLYYAYRVCSVA